MEYACRQAESSGLKNLFSGPLEWCSDWFGSYSDMKETDPVGPAHGFARVVRGGCLGPDKQTNAQLYNHASNRAGIAPGFGIYPGAPGDLGQHRIGFRVVQAPMPATKPAASSISFVQQGVSQDVENARQGPDPSKPCLRKRYLPRSHRTTRPRRRSTLLACLLPSATITIVRR